MSDIKIRGRVHSFQSMGTLDGPGVRFVIFLQGCPLRCSCCHNPDTWDIDGGIEYSVSDILGRAVRFKDYFGKDGGVTVSGGEPLLQARFVKELFEACHREGINTCLDTSGCILSSDTKDLLSVTDRVLLDIKYTSDELYRKNVGCSIDAPLEFLGYLNEQRIPTTVRQVIIPTQNDTCEQVRQLASIAASCEAVDKVELLPFRKICSVKYASLGIKFPFENLPEPSADKMSMLEELVTLS